MRLFNDPASSVVCSFALAIQREHGHRISFVLSPCFLDDGILSEVTFKFDVVTFALCFLVLLLGEAGLFHPVGNELFES